MRLLFKEFLNEIRQSFFDEKLEPEILDAPSRYRAVYVGEYFDGGRRVVSARFAIKKIGYEV